MSTCTTTADPSTLLRDADLPAILLRDGIQVHTRGGSTRSMFARCWSHAGGGERTPSVHIWYHEQRQRWVYFCQSCRITGDALKYLREHQGLSYSEALHSLGQEVLAPLPATRRAAPPAIAHMRASEQQDAVSDFLELVNTAAPQARQRGLEYMVHRGALASEAERTGGAYLLRGEDLLRIRQRLADHPGAERLVAAGLIKEDARGLRPLWWDDVVVGVSCARSGAPMYLWGRRLNHQEPAHLAHIKYLNQSIAGGARSIPFGLDALQTARVSRAPLRIVEGQVTALGSRSLPDGHATPTMAICHRLGWRHTGTTEEMALWQALAPDLKACSSIEISPDNDPTSVQFLESLELASSLVKWLRAGGSQAGIRPLAPRDELGSVDSTLLLPALPFAGNKDYADVVAGMRRNAALDSAA